MRFLSFVGMSLAACLGVSCGLTNEGSESLQNRRGPSASAQCEKSKTDFTSLETKLNAQIRELSTLIENQKAESQKILASCLAENTEICVNPFGGQNMIDKERQLSSLKQSLSDSKSAMEATCKTASETSVSSSALSYGRDQCFVYVGKSYGRLSNDSKVGFGDGKSRVPFISKKALAYSDNQSFEADLIPANYSNKGSLISDVELSIKDVLSPNAEEAKLCEQIRSGKVTTPNRPVPSTKQDSSQAEVAPTSPSIGTSTAEKCHVFKVKPIQELKNGAPYFADEYASRTLGYVGAGKRVYLRLTKKDTMKVKVIDTSSAAYGIEAYMLKAHLMEDCD